MKKILLGINFESESDAAIEDAYLMASKYEASIIPIHAIKYLPRRNQQHEIDLLIGQIDKRLDEIASRLTVRGIDVYKPVIEKGDPLTVLKAACKVLDADLLIIGAGVNEEGHKTLGVTAKAIIRSSPVPVWVSNVQTDMINYEQIACAVDLSGKSLLTLETAASIARQINAKLHVIHVEPDDFYYPGLYNSEIPVSPWGFTDYVKDINVEEINSENPANLLTADYREFLKKVDFTGIDTEIHLKSGKASREILEFAQCYNVGLLVMGTLGKTGFLQKLLGGTVEKVLDRLPCSMLAVPSPVE